MKKPQIIILIAAGLVATGMVTSFLGASIITQGVAVMEGEVAHLQPMEITHELDPAVADTGVFVVQVRDEPGSTLTARVFDPSGIQIPSEPIRERSTEEQFSIHTKGEYRLVLESTDSQATQAVLGLAHKQDRLVEALDIFGQAAILSGFVGVVIAVIYAIVIYAIKTRRRPS